MRTLLAFTVPLALGLGLGACIGEADHTASLCTALCDCQSALPSLHRACVAECEEEVPSDLPIACVTCFLEASCAELVNDACDPECFRDQPPPIDQSLASPMLSTAPSDLEMP